MLTQDAVESLIKQRELDIFYTFSRFGSDPATQLAETAVAPATSDGVATRMFRQNFTGDRLYLTMGPVAKSHSGSAGRRPRFKTHADCIDLRASNGTLVIEPRETLMVSTNERIRLGGKLAAYILPRLTNVDAGLLYTPSYIDPYWDGILQAVIVNVTDRPQSLQIGEPIAICRFYRVEGIVPTSLRDTFPKRSHHFGQAWSKILEEDADPFPLRKRALSPTRGDAALRSLRAAFDRWKGTILSLAFVSAAVGVIYYAGGIQSELQQYRAERDARDEEARRTRSLAADLASFEARLPIAGRIVLSIPAGATRATATIPVMFAPTLSGSLFTSITDGAPSCRASGTIRPSTVSSAGWEIELVVSASASPSDVVCAVEWLIAIRG